MSDPFSSSQPQLSSGSIVVNNYVQRNVRVLAIHEHEVEDISFMNGLSSACFAVMSGLVSFAVSTWVNVAFQTEITATTSILSSVVSPTAILLGLGFGVAGILALRRKRSTLAVIKSQSISQQEVQAS
ncbi:hypothetical protein U0027_06055 [Agrobacterium tumefaciens]|uniref:hypothetical protein n=1 Tax=Agrobacterium tumefaciens TaxID=358 RepID=UPI0013B46AE9|nr:hypothetical protein [Agrobacterium tumefaciens]WQE41074.1 hypothetical protein U0027_06055 [Agrobacterium tumefaciens]